MKLCVPFGGPPVPLVPLLPGGPGLPFEFRLPGAEKTATAKMN